MTSTRQPNMLWVDVETTGLSPRKCAVASIAALANWDTENIFYREIRAWDGAALDPEALRVNGFTSEQLLSEDRPTETQVANEFNAWVMRSFSGPPIICGQNVKFDIDFIGEMYRRAGVVLNLKTRFLDTQAVALFLHNAGVIELPFSGDFIKTNLDVLVAAVLPSEAARTGAHSALHDIWLTRNAYWAMMSRVQDYKAAFDDLQKVKGVPVLTGEQLALDMALGSVENAA
jgi:DNA polymerase III epsilon subunit-like protein